MSRPDYIFAKKPMLDQRRFKIGALDTETYNLHGKLLLAQIYHEDWGEALVFADAKSIMTYLFSLPEKLLRNTIWYSHNAEYDWRYLVQQFKDWGDRFEFLPGERAEGKFYEIKVMDKWRKTPSGRPKLVTTLRDSMAIYSYSLKKLTAQFAPQYVKKDIGLDKNVFDPSNPLHVEYAKNDVIGLVHALKKFDDLVHENFHVHIKGTTASTSYAGWLRFLPEGTIYRRQTRTVEKRLRLFYNGGVVQINAPVGEIDKVRTLDRNSSYAAAMRQGAPKGKAVFTTERVHGSPGIYRVEACVPDSLKLPIIPCRDDKGRLSWPAGGDPFWTWVNSEEIDYAETLGCTFKIERGYFFPDGLTFPFNEMIDVCERLRREFKDTPTETVVKLMQNSLYGRFGMKKEGREVVISYTGEPDDFEPVMNEETGELVDYVYCRRVERNTEYMLPHWSGWICANARIALDRDTTAAGRDKVRYRDTDSISIEGDLSPEVMARIKPDYGALKDEGVKLNIRYHAPKSYTYTDAKGQRMAVYKGLPKEVLDQGTIKALHEGRITKPIEFNSGTSLMTYMKTGKLMVRRARSPTKLENIYGHIIENEWFRPARPPAIVGERREKGPQGQGLEKGLFVLSGEARRLHAAGIVARATGERPQISGDHSQGRDRGVEEEPRW